MLSRQEQQRLVEIEQRLRASEPDLARALREGPRARRSLFQRVMAVLTLFFRRPPESRA
ncbi:DUF3040 domain-containing protein [Lentzea sp. BCCO 10_0856]|uniref:DUF3040 domain-containing protein n=1 Tax=Lentzea miocenica TaxID=3095431 RepID=A0ABU4STA6_9PSEU|nr:DUF3040 domain-containing protein [Lentzea sp. BCCO 10_0856]MDX8029147.1 DUF3040 domain-containing protein [Lentzea sp. BCCO 10_0856]